MLDPGSSISIVSRALADSLEGIIVVKTHTIAKVANGQPLNLLGQCQIPLKIGSSQLSVRFHVAEDLDVPCLIGLDFLEQVPCIIDLVSRRLVFVPTGAVRVN